MLTGHRKKNWVAMIIIIILFTLSMFPRLHGSPAPTTPCYCLPGDATGPGFPDEPPGGVLPPPNP